MRPSQPSGSRGAAAKLRQAAIQCKRAPSFFPLLPSRLIANASFDQAGDWEVVPAQQQHLGRLRPGHTWSLEVVRLVSPIVSIELLWFWVRA